MDARTRTRAHAAPQGVTGEPKEDAKARSAAHDRASNASRAASYCDDGRRPDELALAEATHIIAQQYIGILTAEEACERLAEIFGLPPQGR